jgi:hypothetical protein
MMEKLDDFIDVQAPTSTIVQYYIASIPDIIKLMIPVAVLLSALFVTGRLSSQNELAAIKSSGTSFYRNNHHLLYFYLFKRLDSSLCQSEKILYRTHSFEPFTPGNSSIQYSFSRR